MISCAKCGFGIKPNGTCSTPCEFNYKHDFPGLKEQALPKKGWGAVSTALREWLGSFLDAREAKGIKTYGQSLQIFDGRDNIRDLQEELVDALQYTQKWAMERKALDARIRIGLKILDLDDRLCNTVVKGRGPGVENYSASVGILDILKKAYRSEDPNQWIAADAGIELDLDPSVEMKK